MKPDYFIKEAYRRMSLRSKNKGIKKLWWDNLNNFLNQKTALMAEKQYLTLLPIDKNARILDIGFGDGWFMAACIRMGYTNIYGADFFAKEKSKTIVDLCDNIREVFDIDENIGDFLLKTDQKFDYIHMSHVIEHIPKYSLLYIMDSIYKSQKKKGFCF